MKVDYKLEFTGVLKVANVPDHNKCIYTNECLEQAFKEYAARDRPMLGAIFEPTLSMPIRLEDVAFEIQELKLESVGEQLRLETRCRPLETPKGKVLTQLLELERLNPGTFSMGMSGVAEEIEEKDGVRIVKKFKIERVTFLKTEDKA